MPVARHLILFVKAPRFGAVKTRLARDVGRLTAWTFQRRALAAMFARLGRDPRWRLWIAITPDAFAHQPFRPRPPKGARIVPQGPGDIGTRMAGAFARVFTQEPPGPAVLIGADIPGVRARHVAETFRRLGAHDAVFGPATDGGFWLIGFRRPPPKGVFAGVRWSSPHALADTLANLEGLNVAPPLETLADVDDGAGYAKFRSMAITSGAL